MASNIDWKGVAKEVRLFAIQLQPLRFLALYLLGVLVVILLFFDSFGRLIQ